MINRLSRASIAVKTAAASLAVIVLLLGASALLLARHSRDILEAKGLEQIEQQTRLVIAMIGSYEESLTSAADRLLNTFAKQFTGEATLDAGTAIKVGAQDTPLLKIGSETLNLNLAAVDRFTHATGAVATVFVRKGEDFIRVATSLKNDKGERVLGTMLERTHPGYAKIVAGEDYTGLASLFGHEYMTSYRPLRDVAGKVVGALFVGTDATTGLAALKRHIRQIKIGDTGYFYALDARPGKTLGNLVIHPAKEGSNILDAKDSSGHEFIREMLEKKQGVIRYPWLNKELHEVTPREKIVAYAYFPEWNWVVGGGAYIDEFSRASIALRDYALIAMTIVVLVLGATLFVLIGRMISRPLHQVMAVFDRIGDGHYQNAIDTHRCDEIGALFKALGTMQENLTERTQAQVLAAAEVSRIKSALDKASTSMMVADNDGRIIYMNQAVEQMMRAAEADIRKDLPNFRAEELVGRHFDEFHTSAAHQRHLLDGLKGAHIAQILIGGHTFRLVANPVVNEAGERLGSVVEWSDRSGEVHAERELEELLAAVVKGDFTHRLDLSGKNGFFRILAEGMNQLVITVSTSLSQIAQVLQAVAGGDLTRRIDVQYEGTFGQLKDDTNATVEHLKEVVGRIKEATDAINTAAGEIATGNADLSRRTEEQASSLEETASSMEELSTTVKQNAENASNANELAQGANDKAVQGGQLVKRVVQTMGSIQDASKRIADIIGVIDSLSFQTNILALNAAVEAARAGEQGRGFAVVASEVRTLAQRSAHAAKEIKGLIAESVDRVDAGAELVNQAGQTMSEIVGSFQQVTGLVTGIAGASREQSSGIDQVTQAVSQMEEVTQQNAALVEQAAAAAESLEEQAKALAQAVSVFRLDAGSAPRSDVRPLPEPPQRLPRSIANHRRVRH